MEITIKSMDNKEAGKISLPSQFMEPLRIDLIKKAFEAFMANNRQPYGAYERAGKGYSAKLSRRRHNYRGSYGFGISRVPRKILSRRGTRMYWVGAFAPGTVGGRRAHPPKPEKILTRKINVKERRKAIRSAISASINPDVVKERGHKVPDNYPFIIDGSAEDISKTKDLYNLLIALGFKEELARSDRKKIRAGKGKMRNRRYKSPVGLLIVVSENCPLKRCDTIPGVDVVSVDSLNISYLAPGSVPGRISLWTDKAIKKIEEKSLFK